MEYSWKRIADMALATLSPEELQRSVAYVKPRLLEAGTTITINRQALPITAPSVMAFVDLFPAANWSHPCRYLLINPDSGKMQIIEGQFPPSREGLRIVHRGQKIEDWMLLSEERLE
jgi:hypothetical protein